jgi:hypothetical protein
MPVLFSDHAVKYVIASALRLGGGVDDELGLIAELLDPAGNVGGRVVDRAVFGTTNSAQIGGCHLRNDFFDGVYSGPERRCFFDRFAIQSPRVPYCMRLMPISA